MSDDLEVKLPWYLRITVVLFGVTLLVYGMIVAKPVLVPFLFALFFAILLSPFCGWLEGKKIPRPLAALFSILSGLAIFAGVVFFFSIQLTGFVDDIGLIEERIRFLFTEFENLFITYFDFDPENLLTSLQDGIIGFIRENASSLTQGALSAASTITMVFLIPIYMFLLMIFRDFLKTFVMKAVARGDEAEEKRVSKVINNIKSVIQNYITGMFIVICILAVLNSTALLIIGVNHAIFFAVFAALLNVIPFVGPLLGSVLPIIWALITMDSLIYPIAILLSFYVIQLFESNLFTPTIVGRKVSMNPLVTLILIFTGAQIWGLVGMILFIPFGAILKVIFDEVESLNAYGYLLGSVATDTQTKSRMAEKVSEFSEKISSGKKKKKDKSVNNPFA